MLKDSQVKLLERINRRYFKLAENYKKYSPQDGEMYLVWAKFQGIFAETYNYLDQHKKGERIKVQTYTRFNISKYSKVRKDLLHENKESRA